MSEKVLFELRVHEDDGAARIEIHESEEWRGYHRARHADRAGCGPFVWVQHLCCDDDESAEAPSEPRKRTPRADDLRRALDSLQGIYDDLYGDVTA